jgi:hypothetical protein
MSLLPYHYEADPTSSRLSGFGGILPYLDLLGLLKLPQSIDTHLGTGGAQGWMARHHVLTVLLLNLAGGECVDDVEELEADSGLCEALRLVEGLGLSRVGRRSLDRRFRKGRARTYPSATCLRDWLDTFNDPEDKHKRQLGVAFIPSPTSGLQGLTAINSAFIRETVNLQTKTKQPPLNRGTVDLDAAFMETQKRGALRCYKGFPAYQWLTAYWAETGMALLSEFRDGNVPPAMHNVEVTRAAFDQLTAFGITDLWFRSDSAAYQHELLKMLATGDGGRWPMVRFVLPNDMTKEFRSAASQLAEDDWQPVYDQRGTLQYAWSEVVYVPNAIATAKGTYRYLAIRTPLKQGVLPGLEADAPAAPEPTYATIRCADRTYRLTGLVTNIDDPAWDGPRMIRWCYARCGKGEEVHAIMKTDLAGGQLPSERFGANAAWWGIMLLAFNLHAALRLLVLPATLKPKRFKALRFALLQVPARVVSRGRQLFFRLPRDNPALTVLTAMRKTLAGLVAQPA